MEQRACYTSAGDKGKPFVRMGHKAKGPFNQNSGKRVASCHREKVACAYSL